LKGETRGGGHSAEELKLVVAASRGLGYLPEDQEDILRRVLDLNDVLVREIMVPRHDIVSIPVEAGLDEVLKTMIEQQHSRLPVWEKSPEKIVGVLHYKDLLPVWEERKTDVRSGRPPRIFQVRRLMRKHLVVPETKPVLQMLTDFRNGRSHMALVVDEFGTVTGLLTVEDVLEQIVGDISDEYDERVIPQDEAAEALELEGSARIRDLQDDFGIVLPADHGYETLAGFLLFKLGAIPKAGDAVEFETRRYTVLEMDRHRIAKVRAEKVP
jgi:CBS domain containing-hemolysin-like protein